MPTLKTMGKLQQDPFVTTSLTVLLVTSVYGRYLAILRASARTR
jgi:hypothetical protein